MRAIRALAPARVRSRIIQMRSLTCSSPPSAHLAPHPDLRRPIGGSRFNRLLEIELREAVFQIALKERQAKEWRRFRHDGRARRRADRLLSQVDQAWEAILAAMAWARIEVHEVVQLIPEMMTRYGLSSYDAVHAATASFVRVRDLAGIHRIELASRARIRAIRALAPARARSRSKTSQRRGWHVRAPRLGRRPADALLLPLSRGWHVSRPAHGPAGTAPNGASAVLVAALCLNGADGIPSQTLAWHVPRRSRRATPGRAPHLGRRPGSHLAPHPDLRPIGRSRLSWERPLDRSS